MRLIEEAACVGALRESQARAVLRSVPIRPGVSLELEPDPPAAYRAY
jgi:hypothetical protein